MKSMHACKRRWILNCIVLWHGTWYVRGNSHWLTIIQVILYGQMFIYFYVWSWIKLLFYDRRSMLKWGPRLQTLLGNMGHSRLDSVRLLMMDGSVHIRGTSVVLRVLQDIVNSAWNGLISWVDHMELSYDTILLLHHILYLYCIYDHFVKWGIRIVHWCMWFINNWVYHMINLHHVYYYSISRGLTFVSFSPMKHVLFYSWATFRYWIRVEPRSSCGNLA
jgi:hypothetical protein